MAQFYDVFRSQTQQFVMRADIRVIGLVYSLHRSAEERVTRNGPKPTELVGVKGGDIVLEPVLSDWQPTAFPPRETIDAGI